MRFGTVALIGRTNVGKSTFLNAALGTDLAIVSNVPQTTRDPLLGVLTRPSAQLAFLDTPGLHHPRSELGRRMNQNALEVLRTADAVLFITDVRTLQGKSSALVDPEDRAILGRLPGPTPPAILVVNKVDLIGDKAKLLPLIVALNEVHAFRATVPACLRDGDGTERVLAELETLVPEGDAGYPEDMLTDRPESFFVREYIREQVLRAARREVPHAVAVQIDSYDEGPKLTRIAATIHVEKPGQRRIVIGEGGSMIREIGTQARLRIEALTGRKVHLSLFVRVTPRWKNAPRMLAELGYEASEGGKPSAEPKPGAGR
jgi:GTP-binding protein Era